MSDPDDVRRFVDAKDPVYPAVLDELRAGRKRSHWVLFVFPQLTAHGQSPTAQFCGISDLDEGRAYLAHPVLGRRLRDCEGLVAAIDGRSAAEVLGFPDDLKLRSR